MSDKDTQKFYVDIFFSEMSLVDISRRLFSLKPRFMKMRRDFYDLIKSVSLLQKADREVYLKMPF